MIVYDENRQFKAIECDGCRVSSPPTAEIFIHHGLNGMGWDCRGGKHRCPTCKNDAQPVALAAE